MVTVTYNAGINQLDEDSLMIDKNDTSTVDAFEKKRRGRPPTGNALTSAQKQAAKRDRDFRKLCTDLSGVNLNSLSITAIFEQLPWAITKGRVDSVTLLTNELINRAKKIAKYNADLKKKHK